MGRLSISSLPYPSKPYRISRLTDRSNGRPVFETRMDARAEDCHRATSLAKVVIQHPSDDPTAALDLARRLASTKAVIAKLWHPVGICAGSA